MSSAAYPPVILAIETSSELASAALLRGETMLTREASGVTTHSQSILPMVQSLLQEAGLTLAQCTAVAFGPGPGSFTGVRTACGVAQGLAYGAGIPVIPVITLLAMAEACRSQHGANEVLAVLDARMGEVYWAQYRFTDLGWQEIQPPTLSAPQDLKPQNIELQGELQGCGNGFSAYAAQFAATPLKELAAAAWTTIMPHAAQVAQLARAALAQGPAREPADAQPLYLRNKIALTTLEREAEKLSRTTAAAQVGP